MLDLKLVLKCTKVTFRTALTANVSSAKGHNGLFAEHECYV